MAQQGPQRASGAQNDRQQSTQPGSHSPSSKRDPKRREYSGVISVSARGTGYLAWDATESMGDIEIPKDKLLFALHGDEVTVETTGLKFGRMQGAVTKIVERAKTEFVGTIAILSGQTILAADDRRLYLPFTLEGDVPPVGTKVLAQMTGTTEHGIRGKIIEVIGKSGEHRVEMNAIVLEHGFRTSFPPEVIKEAQEIERNHTQMIQSEVSKRWDYRDVFTTTIDPADAKDFDDALSLKELPDGTYEIGVHIADVTHFVRPGMAMEEEAKKRATSIYLVDATIPMLPHELSGNICSLRQDEDRLAFASIFVMNKEGEVLSRKFGRTIIRSNKRFVYEEAQKVLDDGEGLHFKELIILRDIARKLKAARVKEGAIEFDQDEVKFVLDENGKPLGVVRKQRIETNMLIEDFMLLANREVAKYVADLSKNAAGSNRMFLYRIHDTPKPDRIEELSVYLRAIGYDLKKKGQKSLTARDINNLFKQIEGKPEEQLIKTATIRSMAKAIYSTKNIGHFGLSFQYYTHFTSPIRRYPDMLVHRVLASHAHKEPMTSEEFASLEKLCIHSSEQEAKAVSAERDSIRYKQVEYMQPFVGKEFDAIVSGVADWGIYVEEKETKADGLVRVKSLTNDYFVNDKKAYAMVGKRTGKKYSLGDPIRVKLIAADMATRTLEFTAI